MRVKKNLTEDTVEQAAERAIEAEQVVEAPDDIKEALDEALEDALYEKASGGKDYPNVLLIGKAGTGKSSRVRAWAEANNVNLVTKMASSLDEVDLGGAPMPDVESGKAIKYSAAEFDMLDEPRSVLFLDEFNRARKSVRGTLLTLIQDHLIPDSSSKSGQRYFDNFLFTIAAINPADSNYNTDTLDDAERSRFREFNVSSDKQTYIDYMTKELNRQLDNIRSSSAPEDQIKQRELRVQGQLALLNKVVGDDDFSFDSDADIQKSKDEGNGLITQFRSFTNLLKACRGTKEDFIKKWNQYCNSTKLPLIKQILSDYVDVQDKATDALKNIDTESEVFGKRQSFADRLRNIKVS